ncbi:hypothetical protein ACJX0J_025932 [Zea mays]
MTSKKQENAHITLTIHAGYLGYRADTTSSPNSNMPYHYVYLYFKNTEMYRRIVFFIAHTEVSLLWLLTRTKPADSHKIYISITDNILYWFSLFLFSFSF